MFMILIIVLLNLFISYWNAKQAGKVWAEVKAIGGWIRLVTWCAVIQSVIGFTFSYAIILGLGAHELGFLSAKALSFMMSFTYILIIVPALGSGLVLTINSWIQFSRDKSLSNLGVASYNTFAQAYNTYRAIQDIGPAFSEVLSGFGGLFDGDSDDEEDTMVKLAIGLVIVAALAGVVSTAVIVKRNAGTLPVSESVRESRALEYK